MEMKPVITPSELSPGRIRDRQEWTIEDAGRTGRIMNDYMLERRRQNEKHPGTVDFPDGTGQEYAYMATLARAQCDHAFANGECSWRLVLAEEFFEAICEEDTAKLRAELVQVMAVAGRWVETLDARDGK
jgi:hypothetical protein